MISALLYPYGKNKRSVLSKVLISEVTHTRYNTTYQTEMGTKEEIAEAVADVIMDEYEKVLIERYVKTNYSFMEKSEQEGIVAEAEFIRRETNGVDFPSYEQRKRLVKHELLKYLEETELVVPCGFVDFRFRQMYFWVEGIVAKGADMFFEKKEYEEFTYLLSMFVATKESKEEVIHVVWEDTVRLYNKRGRDVTKKYEKEFFNAARKNNLSDEDLVISAVIAAAPKKIVLHSPPETPLAGALGKIYQENCKICRGCNVCKRY